MRPMNLLTSITIFGSFALTGCVAQYSVEERVQYPPPGPAVVVVQEPVYVAPAPQVVTTFQADLNPYGQWVVVANYGQCWRPTQVVQTWRPYTVGHWVWTDYGWTWASEEPWGDATCHYGRWFLDAQFGWVWMPGSTWAPAWVAWRSGGGYVGWAPLPPTVAVGVSVQIGEAHTREIPAAYFSFVEERRVAEPRIHEHITSVQSNTTIITKTVNITNITTVNNTVVNKSLTVEHVERAAGHKVARAAVKEVSSEAEAKQARTRGEVAAYRPKPLIEAERVRVDDARRREAAPAKRADADRPKDVKPEPVKPARVEPDRTRAADLQRLEAEKAKAAEAERVRVAELQRQEKEKANATAAKRAEAEKARAAELKRTEAEKAKAADAERAKATGLQRQEADRAKAAELKRQEAEKIKAAEAEKAKATDHSKRELPKAPPAGETKEQAAERAKREAAEKDAAERAKKDRGDGK